MLHCKGLKRDTANSLWFAQREDPAIIHSTALQRLPRLLRRKNGARRTILQAPGVTGMCMRQHDRVGSQSSHSPQPVESAVDYHAPDAMPDKERSVHTMLAVCTSISPRVPRKWRCIGPSVRSALIPN